MTRDQFKYLETAFRSAKYDKEREVRNKCSSALPKEVKAAKRVLKVWDAKQQKLSSDRYSKVAKLADVVWVQILFGDPELALKSLNKFKATKV